MIGIKRESKNTVLRMLVMCICFLVSAPGFALQTAEINRAADLLDQGDTEAAQAVIRQIENAGYDDPRIYLQVADLYIRMGAGISAEAAIKRARDLGISYSASANLLAKAMLLQGRFEKAIESLSGTQLDSEAHGEALIILADSNFALGKYDVARRFYDQFRQEMPNGFQAYLGLGRLALQAQDLEAAREYLTFAELRAPQNSMVQYTFGQLEKLTDKNQEAKARFERAIDLFPGNLLAALELASAYINEGDIDQAERFLDRVYAVSPSNPVALYLSAVIEVSKQNYEAANAYLLRARSITERYLPAMTVRATVAYALNDYQTASRLLERVLAARPGAEAVRTIYAATLAKLERYKESYEAIRPVVFGASPNPASLIVAASALLGMGDTDGAQALYARVDDQAYEGKLRDDIILSKAFTAYLNSETDATIEGQASDLSNDALDTRNLALLAALQMRRGQLDAAQSTIDRLKAIALEQAVTHNLQGSLNYRLGRYDAAQRDFSAALQRRPDYDAALKNRALVSLELGDFATVQRDLGAYLEDNASDSRARAILAKAEAGQAYERPEVEAARKGIARAIGNFSAVYEEFARDADFAVDYADALMFAGSRQRAIDVIRRAASGRDDPDILASLGARLLDLNASDAAARLLSRLRAIEPDQVRSHILYGRALYGAGIYRGALSAFELATRFSLEASDQPGDSTASVDALSWYIFACDLALAAEGTNMHERFMSLNPTARPGDMSPSLEGDVWIKSGDLPKAAEHYQQAFLESGDEATLLKLTALRKTDPDSVAAQAIERMLTNYLETFPRAIEPRRQLADFLYNERDFVGAASQYDLLIREGFTSPDTLAKAARSFYESGGRDAVTIIERARILAPDNAGVLDSYGWIILQEKRDIPAAITALRRANRLAPGDAEILYHMGMALAAEGDESGALAALDEALKKDDDFHGRAEADRQLKRLQRLRTVN